MSKKIFAKVTIVEKLNFVFLSNAGRSGILFFENSSNCLMQISLHRTRNTKQEMRGHNIVGDRWVGAASHHPNSRTTLEMLDNLSKTLKLP